MAEAASGDNGSRSTWRNAGAIGFVGLGVMGEPMCRNLAVKSGRTVIGYDIADAPLERLAEVGVERAASLARIGAACRLIFLALPSGRHVEEVCLGAQGLLQSVQPGSLIVDLGTSPVALAKDLAQRFQKAGAAFADAPIARTRQAAIEGTLSIMVGADDQTFAALQPLLAMFAAEVTHCGPAGSGQVVKILNNMVLVETVVALSEALAVATRCGVAGNVLFETLAKGSADSFALRNHGMKAMLPGAFPERAFSTEYARKDLSYALQLAEDTGVQAQGAQLASRLLQRASDAGWGDLYWPVVSRVIADA